MESLSIFGETLTLEFEGELGDASKAENVTASNRTGAIQKADPKRPAAIEWTFTSSGGDRAVYVQYSSANEAPCELLINDQVVQRNALSESTHGVKLVDWRYQCTVGLESGKNRIAIRSDGPLPHIRSVAVGAVPARPQTSVDDYFERLSKERSESTTKEPFKLQPAQMAGLMQIARRLAHDDAAIRTLGSISRRAVTAAQEHTYNGQAGIPWAGPLNGQRYRQHIFERLMRVGADAVIETGTFLGTSTAFFARHGVPVRSCELREEYFAAAVSQLTAFDNITLYLMDSRAFLSEIAGDRSLEYRRPFFYLDAHWYDDLPLADEIRIIQDNWSEYFIMVDDFCVPEAQYNFDRYPNGLELTLDHLDKEGIDLSEMAILFPTAAATAETSARRGTLILTPLSLYENYLREERSMFRYFASSGI